MVDTYRPHTRVKMLLLGDSYTGKSCFLATYKNKRSTAVVGTTIGCEFYRKSTELMQLHIVDTAGTVSSYNFFFNNGVKLSIRMYVRV